MIASSSNQRFCNSSFSTKLLAEKEAVISQEITKKVIGSPVTSLPFNEQIGLMLNWASSHQSKVVCLANVHMLVEAHWHPEFSTVLQSADLVTPDGMPLVWMLRLMGVRNQDRVAGIDVLSSLCQLASLQNVSVFFLGSHSMILDRMRAKLEQEFPDLRIAGMEPLPFRPLTQSEDDAVIQKIHESGAGLVFVSLGCPKQEIWMAQHKGKIQAVTVGLGGAFPVYAGVHKRAPRWIRESGLEWAYRLVQEPRRLWSRYWKTNTTFIYLALKQMLALLVTCPNTQSSIELKSKYSLVSALDPKELS